MKGVTDAPLETLARRDRRDVVEHHHTLITDMPKENTLRERPREVGMRQDDLLITQDLTADDVIFVLLLYGEHGKACRQEITDDLAFIIVELIPFSLAIVSNRCFIG